MSRAEPLCWTWPAPQIELEKLLGIKVEVFTEGDLHHRLKEQILAEARPLVAA